MSMQVIVPNPKDILDLLDERGLVIFHPKQLLGRNVLCKLLDCSGGTIDNRGDPDHKGFDPKFPKKREKGGNSIGWMAGEVFDYIDTLPYGRTCLARSKGR